MPIKFRYPLVCLCLIVAQCIFAQQKQAAPSQILKILSDKEARYDGDTTDGKEQVMAPLYAKLIKASELTNNYSCVSQGTVCIGKYYVSISLPDKALKIISDNKRFEDLGTAHKYAVISQLRRLEAWAYVQKNDYDHGLDRYLEALKVAEKHQLADEKATVLNNIAVLYISMYDPKNLPNTKKGLAYAARAIEAIKKVETDSLQQASDLSTAYINYGDLLNSYGTDTGQHKFQIQAIEIFRKAIALQQKIGDRPSQCQVYANLAYTYKNLGQKENYYNCLIKSYDIMQSETQGISVYVREGVHFALGEYYNDDGEFAQAVFHLKQAEQLLQHDKAKDLQIMNLVLDLGRKVYENLGDYKLAYRYQRDYWKLKDSLLNAETLRKFEEMEVKYQSEHKGRQLKEADLQLENVRLTRNAVIAVAALLALSLFLFYLSYTSKNKALLFKKQAADTALQIAELEIQANRQLLDQYTQSLVDKNHLIDILEKQLLQSGRADDDALSRLSNSRILTQDDWAEYKRLFDNVYPGFFLKLRQKYPNLTEAEERIMAFSKLNINLKESANLLGISYESLKNSRYRLRKKMGVESDTDLREISAAL